MNFDFPLLLTILTLFTGAVWLLDALLFAPGRRARAARAGGTEVGEGAAVLAPPKAPVAVEYARSFFPILAAVLVFRSFIAEPFRIPTGSMIPTLLIGDFIVVNKWSYGLRLPVTNTKILDIGEPRRGDVVVFFKPRDPRLNPDPNAGVTYVKRLVGLPGDRIRYTNHQLYINGEPVAYERIGGYVGTAQNAKDAGQNLLRESLGEVQHQILHWNQQRVPNMPQEVLLGPGEYFMMGDNRDGSSDSRDWGPVPEANLVGRVSYIWMHWDGERPGYVAWSRLFSRVL